MEKTDFHCKPLNKKINHKLYELQKIKPLKDCKTQEACIRRTSNLLCNILQQEDKKYYCRKCDNKNIFSVGFYSHLTKTLKILQKYTYMYSYAAPAITAAVSTIAVTAAETVTTTNERLKWVYENSRVYDETLLHNNTVILATSSSATYNSVSSAFAISFGNFNNSVATGASSSVSTFATNASTPLAPSIDGGVNATLTSTGDWSHFYDLILSWQGIFLIAVFAAFIVITIIGNTLIILAVITTRRLKTVTNCFVMSLAVADLLVGIFVMPPAVAVHLIGSWQLGWVLCDIWISLDVLLCTASILSLCAISVDRYLAVTQPLTYSRKRRSKRLALIMILIVWVSALAITCPPILGWYEPGRRDLNECRYNQNEGYVIFSAMGSFFIPMAVMIYVYARISCVIANRHDNMTDISVHNKKLKRYTAADIDNELDPDLSELDLSSAQKKQQVARTLSNQTLAKDLQAIIASDSKSGHAAQCHSLLALQKITTSPTNKNGCYEMKRPASLKRSPTASSGMTTITSTTCTTGGTALATSGIAMENPWTFTPTSQQQKHAHPNKQMRTHNTRQQHYLDTTATSANICHSLGNPLATDPIATGSGSSILRPHTPQLRSHQQVQQQQHSHHYTNKSLSNRISSLKKETKTTQTLSIVVGGFIACWLPFFINYLITPFLNQNQVSSTLAKVLTWLGWFNSAINPFIYAFYSVDFRAAFWRLTCKRFFSSSSKPQFPTNTMSIRR